MIIQSLINTLIEKNLTIGSIESFTGGLFGSMLVNYPGVSATYKGTIVAYANDVKQRLLNVKREDIKKFSAVSSVVALELARHGQKALDVDFCIAFTGNAGPTATVSTGEVGDVYIALAYGKDEIVEHFKFKGDRQKVRNDAVAAAISIIARVLKNYE
ncbi:MAG: CinA family protein [Bacilli bacterium]|jgi:PncC family amidohydrolase